MVYDTIIFYCPVCKEKNNVQVIHEKAKKAFFQSTNIPAYVAVSIKSQKINLSQNGVIFLF